MTIDEQEQLVNKNFRFIYLIYRELSIVSELNYFI